MAERFTKFIIGKQTSWLSHLPLFDIIMIIILIIPNNNQDKIKSIDLIRFQLERSHIIEITEPNRYNVAV